MIVTDIALYYDSKLVVDSNGHVYYRGRSMSKIVKIGSDRSIDDNMILLTNVRLNQGETIKKLYATNAITAFYTSENKLYVSRNFDPNATALINNNVDNIADPAKICGNSIADSYQIYRDEYPLSSEPGFDLLETDVDDVVFSEDAVLFMKAKRICFFSIQNIRCLEMNSIMTKIVGKPFGYYYMLLIPLFGIDNYVCGYNFIYMKNKFQQYILSLSTLRQRITIKLLHFDLNPKIEVDNIILYKKFNKLIFITANILYEYSLINHTIAQLHTGADRICHDTTTNHIYFNSISDNVQYINIYNDAHTIKNKQLSTNISIVKFFALQHNIGLIINNTDFDAIGTIDDIIYLNIAKVKYYGISHKNIVYRDTTNVLYLVTTSMIGMGSSIKNISATNWGDSGFTYYRIYPLTNFEEDTANIITIKSMDREIIIQTHAKLYIFHSDSNILSEVIVYDENTYVDRLLAEFERPDRNIRSTSIDMIVDTRGLFNKLLTVYGTLTLTDTIISVAFIDRIKHVTTAFGKGATKEFINEAMMDFSRQYLIVHPNRSVEYNTDSMKLLTDIDLVTIGNLINYILLNHCVLPIRLPLTLLSSILKKIPTDNELEYFLRIYDQDVLTEMAVYKYDYQAMMDVYCESYSDALRTMCKFRSNESIKRFDHFISLGFENNYKFKNLATMNIPTLDFMLSGDFVIDKKKFANGIEFIYHNRYNFDRVAFKTAIQDLTDNQFKILVKNWSASYVVNPKANYQVDIELVDTHALFKIQTCSNTILLNYNENLSDIDNLISNLANPILSMRD